MSIYYSSEDKIIFAKIIFILINNCMSFDEDWKFLEDEISKKFDNKKVQIDFLEEIKYQYYLYNKKIYQNKDLENLLSSSKSFLNLNKSDDNNLVRLPVNVKFQIYSYLLDVKPNRLSRDCYISHLIRDKTDIILNQEYKSGLKIGYASAIKTMRKSIQNANQR
jgi:hypothetical protein